MIPAEDKHNSKLAKDDSSTSASSSEQSMASIPATSSAWGNKKSFADILKATQMKEESEAKTQ